MGKVHKSHRGKAGVKKDTEQKHCLDCALLRGSEYLIYDKYFTDMPVFIITDTCWWTISIQMYLTYAITLNRAFLLHLLFLGKEILLKTFCNNMARQHQCIWR